MNKLQYYCNNTLSIEDEYRGIFGKSMPQGKMFCPFHDNHNTPAAKHYGNIIKCFSCGRVYGVYDLLEKYNPARIEQLKETADLQNVEVHERKLKYRRFPIHKFDKSRSMLAILLDLQKSFEDETEKI